MTRFGGVFIACYICGYESRRYYFSVGFRGRPSLRIPCFDRGLLGRVAVAWRKLRTQCSDYFAATHDCILVSYRNAVSGNFVLARLETKKLSCHVGTGNITSPKKEPCLFWSRVQ